MKYTIFHRPIGKPEIKPEKVEIEAQSRTEALSIFYDEHQDLPVMVVKLEFETS